MKRYFKIGLFALATSSALFSGFALANPGCLTVLVDCYDGGGSDADCSGRYYQCKYGPNG